MRADRIKAYVDANDLIKKIRFIGFEHPEIEKVTEIMISEVENQKTVRVQPVKYSRWKRNAMGEISCASCSMTITYDRLTGWQISPFCPWCGCKMKNHEKFFYENE